MNYETENIEFKAQFAEDIYKEVIAFANTDGGVILLGVREVDRKFSIVGVPKAATLIKRFWDGVNNREKVSVNILFDRHACRFPPGNTLETRSAAAL